MTIKDLIKKSPIYPLASAINKSAKAVYRAPKKISNMVLPKTIVLLYHRVCDLKNDPESLAIPPKRFEEQISYLKNNYTVLSLADFYNNLQKKKIAKNAILITFDDGYLDNFSYAFPILKKHHIPAVIFVADPDEEKEFWWDELARIIHDPSEYKILHAQIKSLPRDKQEKILNEIRARKNMPLTIRPDFARMGPEECETLTESGLFAIGGHTKNHAQLSALTSEEQKNEIRDNFDFIKKIEKKSPLAFAYPFGTKNDYNKDSVRIVKKHYQCAFSNFKDQVRKNTDPYQIPRFVVKNWDKEEFEKKIKSFFI